MSDFAESNAKSSVESGGFVESNADSVSFGVDSGVESGDFVDSGVESPLDSAKFNKSEFDILVAKCGKTIGLKGEIKLIIYSDFLDVFTKGNVFLCKSADSAPKSSNATLDSAPKSQKSATDSALESPTESTPKSSNSAFFLTLNSFNPHKNSATFSQIKDIDSAKNLTSMLLFSSKSLTKKYCALGENEHFWFEVIGRSVVENGAVIGVVGDIWRIGSVDYLIVEVERAIFAKYPHIKAKRFYLPYISRYVLGAENGVVVVKDAISILENS